MSEVKIAKPFHFKQFSIEQDCCPMKVGTDGVLLGAWADVEAADSILDIGTGTGLIAIMLAQRNTKAQITGVEIDEAAYQQAKDNMKQSPWAERLSIVCQSIQKFAKLHRGTYDLVVSNPPFFSGGTFSDNQDKNSVRHTIKLPHGDLLVAVRSLLKMNGKFCVILPRIEGLRFKEMAHRYHFFCTKITEAYPKKEKKVERLLLQFEKTEQPLVTDSLVIQKEKRNDWTQAYIDLTGEFYLKM